MNSTDTENSNSPVGLLGEYLKQRRQEKNFSLEKLSQKTKISVNILKSLEANDYKKMPSAAYIKGFVLSYAKVLGLPNDEIINKMEYTYLKVLNKPFPALNHTKLMKDQAMASVPSSSSARTNSQSSAPRMSTTNPVTAKAVNPVSSSGTAAAAEPNPKKVIESGDSIIKNTKSIIPLAILAAVIVLFVIGYKLVSSVVDSEVRGQKVKDLGPRIESSAALVKPDYREPPAPVMTTPPVTENTPDAATVPPPAAGVTPAEKTEPAPVEPVVVQKKPEPIFPRNFPTVDFKKVQGPLFEVVTEDSENNEHLSAKAQESFNSALQNVYIKAVDGNTWLSYKVDNKPIDSIIITQGNDLFLQGQEIRVFLGNVNVTRIFYNNFLIKTPTKSGVKSLIFPESSNSKYLLPLFPKANDDILHTSEDYIKRMKLEEEELAKRQQQNRNN